MTHRDGTHVVGGKRKAAFLCFIVVMKSFRRATFNILNSIQHNFKICFWRGIYNAKYKKGVKGLKNASFCLGLYKVEGGGVEIIEIPLRYYLFFKF